MGKPYSIASAGLLTTVFFLSNVLPVTSFVCGPLPMFGSVKNSGCSISTSRIGRAIFGPPTVGLRMTTSASSSAEAELIEDRATLLRAAKNRDVESDKVVEALQRMEKASRACKDEAVNSALLSRLTGSWRLIFTTGDKTTQGVIGGRINYFPIKAVQTFDCSSGFISNGVYLGPFSLVFSGRLNLVPRMRRLEFFFDRLALGPLSLPISAGLDAKVKPAFSWIDVNDDLAAGRGAGGGLAIWLREPAPPA